MSIPMSASGYGLYKVQSIATRVAGGFQMPANVLWIIALVIAIIGVIVLINGSVIGGIILLVVAALVGPGGYSIFNRRA
jgi:drug/metabolite transporter (DMT)-like permease